MPGNLPHHLWVDAGQSADLVTVASVGLGVVRPSSRPERTGESAILVCVTVESPTSFDENQFQLLRAEWTALLEARRREVSERWVTSVGPMRAEYDALLAAGRWTRGPGDFFSIVGLSRSEVHHSAMVAWLLDPSARHGLGDHFLRNLLAVCFSDETAEFDVRSVECEVSRGDTRADIVVWGDQQTLVIENKVDAPEGDRQCDRLYERFGDEIGARFVFLSPSGRFPRTATGEAVSAFSALSYSTLAECLSGALARSSMSGADGRPVAVNFLSTIKEQFG